VVENGETPGGLVDIDHGFSPGGGRQDLR
jgi:hypothetical protein